MLPENQNLRTDFIEQFRLLAFTETTPTLSSCNMLFIQTLAEITVSLWFKNSYAFALLEIRNIGIRLSGQLISHELGAFEVRTVFTNEVFEVLKSPIICKHSEQDLTAG